MTAAAGEGDGVVLGSVVIFLLLFLDVFFLPEPIELSQLLTLGYDAWYIYYIVLEMFTTSI
jgi:hypothetical protein